jgi:hypothetical protein
MVTAVVVAVISAWMIVASLIFSRSTVQNLALGAPLAISGLAVVGPSDHEGRCVRDGARRSDGGRPRYYHATGVAATVGGYTCCRFR